MEKPRKQYIILNKALAKIDANSVVDALLFYAKGSSDSGVRAENALKKLGVKYQTKGENDATMDTRRIE